MSSKGKSSLGQKSHFLPRAMRKTGVPAKLVLWGGSTVGLSHGSIAFAPLEKIS